MKALTKDHKEESPHQDKIQRKRGKDRRRRKEHGEGKDHGLEHNSLYWIRQFALNFFHVNKYQLDNPVLHAVWS